MKTAMNQMLDELMAHEYTIPLGLIVKCKELIEVEKEQIIQSHYIGGCYFHEARDCRNSEAPCINDAYYYYDEMYNNGL